MTQRPTPRQAVYLSRGLTRAGGRLSLFDEYGQEFSLETIEACVRNGWAVPGFQHPINPDWLVCRLTEEGIRAVEAFSRGEIDKSEEESSI